jgi:hypothetical protein
MSTQTTERIWSEVDLAKVTAGTLAALSAAVCASVLGVAGTLIGAAVASVVGTIGQELYTHSLRHGYRRLQQTRAMRVSASAATPGTVVAHDPAASDDRQATASTLRSSAARAENPGAGAHPARSATEPAPRARWRRVVVATLAAFALAMIVVTAVELVGGRSLAAMFGDDNAGRTTFSGVVDGPRTPAATPDVTPDAPAATPGSGATGPGGAPAPTSTPGTGQTAAPTGTPPAQDSAPAGPGLSPGP